MKNKAIRTVSMIWLASLAGAGVAFLTQVLLARKLGPDAYGTFSAAMVAVGLLVPIAGVGLSQFILKIFGEEGWYAFRWFPSIRALFKKSIFLTLVLLLLLSLFLMRNDGASIVVIVLLFHVLGQSAAELVGSKLQLEELYGKLAGWQLSPHFLRLLILMVFWYIFDWNLSVVEVGVIYSLIGLVIFTYGLLVFHKISQGELSLVGHGEKKKIKIDDVKVTWKDVARESWPFGLASLFHLIYFQSSILQIKLIVGSEGAGIYNVAFSIMLAIYLLPSVIYQRFLMPKIHRWANQDSRKLYQVFKSGNYLMSVLGIFAMVFIYFLSGAVVKVFFGIRYIQSIEILEILAFSTPFMFVAFSAGAMLSTKEHMKFKVLAMGGVAIFNLILNYLFISSFGLKSAAYVTVASNLMLMLMYLYGASRFVFKKEVP